MELTSAFAPISKTVEQDDGSLLVYGKATDGGLDLDDQRCDPTWLAEAMPAWFGTGTGVGGNIRAQHRSDSAVGKAIEHEAASDGHYITAKIVDRDAIAKTRAGVFTGFSIGVRRPKIVKSPTAPNGLINGGMITEVSLCDRPANPACTLTLCKSAVVGWEGSSADLDQERGLVKCEEFSVDRDLVAACVSDGAMTLNKARTALGLPEFELDGGGETGNTTKTAPSPLDMPGAKKTVAQVNVVLDGQRIQKIAQDVVHENNVALTNAMTGNAVKTTDVDKLDAPAPGQKCADCGEAGHLTCGSANAVKAAETPTFDRAAAIALVKTVLAKADGTLTGAHDTAEASDISNAQSAIAMIAGLITSEASELAEQPSELIDISLLLDAVQSLQAFIRREQSEQTDITPSVNATPSMVCLAADEDVSKVAKYDAAQLAAMLKAGTAMKNPNGDPSYPIGDKADLSNAISAVGRGSGDHDAIRAYIVRRAKALGASDMIPDNWSSSGDNTKAVAPTGGDTAPTEAEAVEPDAAKTVEPDAVKAADVSTDTDAIFKALTGDLEKDDSPLRKLFVTIAEASTKSAVEALGETLGARLEKVEQMATPGGPALRRTENERIQARKSDLAREAARFKALANVSEDPDLRKGYAVKAAQIEAEVKALVA